MDKFEQRIYDLQEQGASNEDIEEAKMDLIRFRYENIDFDNLTDGEDYLNSLDEGES